jgi:hypothetical protein
VAADPADDPATWIIGILNFLFQVYNLMLLVRILLEWVQVSYSHPVMRFLWDATEPLLSPSGEGFPWSPDWTSLPWLRCWPCPYCRCS